MGFHEIRLPLALSFGAMGGPVRKIEVTSLGSGAEQRNAVWAQAQRRYDLSGAARTLDDVHMLIAFFEARGGKLNGFRFRDPLDHKSCAPSAAPGPLDQPLGIGDGASKTFQIAKIYADAAGAATRFIRKPVAGSVRVAIAGVEQAGIAFSANTETGEVTFATAPAAGAVLTAGYVFDTPVRFDIDQLEASLDGFGAGHVGAVMLTEVLV
jgi:uncharacterized protein (TIGR02217 family)